MIGDPPSGDRAHQLSPSGDSRDSGRIGARPAPASVWLLTVLLFAVVCLVGLVIARSSGVPASARFVSYNEGRLQAAARGEGEAHSYLIVLLGSSALKYATRDDAELAERLTAHTGNRVRVLRIVNNWGVFGDFERLGSTIEALNPDLIVFQREMLVSDRPWSTHFLLLAQYYRWRLAGTGEWDHRPEDPELVQFDTPCWRRPGVDRVEVQTERKGEWVTIDPSGPGARAAQEFIGQMVAGGTKVALAHVPRRPDFEQIASIERDAAIGVVLDRLPAHGVVDWGGPQLPESLYCDITHVNQQGRQAYSAWLEARISQAIDSRS